MRSDWRILRSLASFLRTFGLIGLGLGLSELRTRDMYEMSTPQYSAARETVIRLSKRMTRM